MNFEYFELTKPINSVVDLQKYELTKAADAERFIFPYEIDRLAKYFGLNFSGYIVPARKHLFFKSLIRRRQRQGFRSLENQGVYFRK